MMKSLPIPTVKTLFTALCLVISGTAVAQDVELSWARHISGSISSETGNIPIVADASGNVYTTGSFSNTVDFNPGPGVANLISAGSADIFVSKLDASGNYLWAKSMGGMGMDESHSIAVDLSGNVYITGYFQGRVDFDPGVGTAYLGIDQNYNSNIFIVKLDANGNYQWARSMGGSGIDIGGSIAVDASGNVYTTGSFQFTVDFDPGEGEANLTSTGFSTFISKLDTDGNYLWAKSIGGSFPQTRGSVAVDASGNVYTKGVFSGAVDFDPGDDEAILTSAVGYEVFICKLDTDGNYLWAKKIRGDAIAVDGPGNVYLAGGFSGTVDFDPGDDEANLISAGGSDIFISKLDAGGNYLWARRIGGSGHDVAKSIVVDGSGNVYTTGSFAVQSQFWVGPVDFDPGEGTANLRPDGNGGTDIFFSKLGAGGNYLWAKRIGARYNDVANAIAVDGSGNVYATGSFTGAVDFDPNAGMFAMTSVGESDNFVLKLSPQEESPIVVDAHISGSLGSCYNCDIDLFKIENANDRNQYVHYVYGDALTFSAEKYTLTWNGSIWKAVHFEKSLSTSFQWHSTEDWYGRVATNGLNTSPKPPCTGWGGWGIIGFSLSGDCVTPSVAVQVPSGAPAMNASAVKTTGVVSGKNAYEIPVIDGAEGEKVFVRWNTTASRWEMIHMNPSSRMAAETVLSYNSGNDGVNPPCGGWSGGYGLSGDICTSGPLPVTLLSFSATLTDSKNEVGLNWSATSEDNAWYYGLERSGDAKQFEEIARITASGNSTETTTYIHTDAEPLRGRSYYRLRQVDGDESFTYSPIVSVLTTVAGVPYPNPAKNGIIRIQAASGAVLKLTDISGREVPFAIKRISEEVTEIHPAQSLQSGVYVLTNNGVGYRVVID